MFSVGLVKTILESLVHSFKVDKTNIIDEDTSSKKELDDESDNKFSNDISKALQANEENKNDILLLKEKITEMFKKDIFYLKSKDFLDKISIGFLASNKEINNQLSVLKIENKKIIEEEVKINLDNDVDTFEKRNLENINKRTDLLTNKFEEISTKIFQQQDIIHKIKNLEIELTMFDFKNINNEEELAIMEKIDSIESLINTLTSIN